MATMLAYPKHGILLNPSPSSYPSSLPFPSEPSSSSAATTTTNSSPFGSLSAAFTRSPFRNSLQLAPGPSHDAPPAAPAAAAVPRSTLAVAHPPSASSLSSSASSAAPTPSRKIRFAPLPDPRRAVCVTDDGEELPFDTHMSDGSDDAVNEWGRIADERPSPGADSPPADDDGATPLWSTPAISPAAAPASAATTPASEGACSTPSSPFMSKTRKLFKPLFSSKLPEVLNVSSDSLGLFRTSSRDSTRGGGTNSRASSRERAQSDGEVLGAPLGRSTSAGSTGSKKGKKGSTLGVPFRRTQSYDTVQAATHGAPLGRSTSAGMQGQRMLNGRVYGARRFQQKNPFANIPDREPEFVEWGYGGMGSVKAAKESGNDSVLWAPLQQQRASIVSANDDDDGGSGMGWVRRRREEKERLAREAASAPSTAPSTAPSSAPTSVDTTPESALSPLPETPTSAASTPRADGAHAHAHTGESSEYMHTTMCLRPPVARGRSSALADDDGSLPTVTEGVATGTEAAAVDAPASSNGSSSESTSPADSVEDVSEADDEETAAAYEARVTAKGASVEFISKRKRT